MGIHYPSDNEAARQIAHQMIRVYFQNKTIKADLKAAQAEWRAKAPGQAKLSAQK
jgi:acid phosphatase (class A)